MKKTMKNEPMDQGDPVMLEPHGKLGGGPAADTVPYDPYEGASNPRFYVAVPFEYHKEMEYLSNEEFGALIRALLRFGMTGEVPTVDGVLRHYINRVIERQKRFQEDWRTMSEMRSKAGRKGAYKRWNKGKVPGKESSPD